MNKLVPIEDVSEHLNVSVSTVRKWIRDGVIPENTYMKVGYTQRFDLELVVNELLGYKEGDEYLEELRSVKLPKTIEDAEGHWTCRKYFDTDSDHGPCSGYEIEELGITIYTYHEDPTRISIHRGD